MAWYRVPGYDRCPHKVPVEPSNPVFLQPGTMFRERYRVVRCIKTGSMGAVYEVADDTTNSRRALKVMLPGVVEDPDLRARFALEAKITGNVESDHLVRVSDAGIDASTGTPFLIMDLLRGEELGSLSRRRGPLPPTEVLTYVTQVALALDKTHAAGIVHRDLKPENLFVTTRDDGTPCVKILDFGIAKLAAQSTHASGTMPLGTPLYMSPEQIRGDGDIGPRTDIYALGHIVYTLLVGEPYWKEELKSAASLFPFLTKVLGGALDPASVRAMRHGVQLSPEFDAWFQRAISPHPESRFEGAKIAVASLADSLGLSSPRAMAPSKGDPDAWSAASPGYASDPQVAAGSGPLVSPPTQASTGRGGTTDAAILSMSPGRRHRSAAVPVTLALLCVASVIGGLAAWRAGANKSAPGEPITPTAAAAKAITPSQSAPSPVLSEPSAAPAPSPAIENKKADPPSTVAATQPRPAPTGAAPRTTGPRSKANGTDADESTSDDSASDSGGTGVEEANGSLVAVASGGSCLFSVDGISKGSGTSIRVSAPPGMYVVSCKPYGALPMSKRVTVNSGQTTFAAFRIEH